jgi:hypothetical protein
MLLRQFKSVFATSFQISIISICYSQPLHTRYLLWIVMSLSSQSFHALSPTSKNLEEASWRGRREDP